MPTVEASGTTLTDGTEQTLSSLALNRSYQLVLDLVNLAAGDTIVVRSKRRILAAGTEREFERVTYSNAQDPPIASLNPFPASQGATFTLQRTAGTDRSILWSLESL